MGFLSKFSADTTEEKIAKWRKKLVKELPKFLEDDDKFIVEDEGDVVIRKGSANVWVEFGVDDNGRGSVTINSPLVHLPKDQLLPFYRKLLDLNNDSFRIGKLSTFESFVVLTRTIPADGLDKHAFLSDVKKLCLEADDLDDQLIQEFNAPRFRIDDE